MFPKFVVKDLGSPGYLLAEFLHVFATRPVRAIGVVGPVSRLVIFVSTGVDREIGTRPAVLMPKPALPYLHEVGFRVLVPNHLVLLRFSAVSSY